MLYSRSFIVLHFIFKSVIHLESVFLKGVNTMSRFTFFYMWLSVPGLFVGETVFAPLHCFCSFTKDHSTILLGVHFWALSSVPLISLSILLTILHCLDYCSFAVSLGVISTGPPAFVVLQYCDGYSGSWNQFVDFCKITFWDFD